MVRKQQKNETYTTYDLHGYKLEDAIEYVENLIGRIRLSGVDEVVKVITGRGVIRIELKKYLDSQGIENRYELGNDAVFVITVD